MQANSHKDFMIPNRVVRYLRGFRTRLQKEVYRHLEDIARETGVEVVAREHVELAISRATKCHFEDGSVVPDMGRIERSLNDIASCRFRSIGEVISDIQRKCA